MPKEVSPILDKASTHTGVMRGRDVRRMLTNKIDPALQGVLEQIAEINHTNTLAIAELATMQDKLIDLVRQFGDVAENMKTRTDQMARAMTQEIEGDEGAGSTH